MIPPPPVQQNSNGASTMASPPSRPASKKQRANGGTPVGNKTAGPPPPQFRNVSLSAAGNNNRSGTSSSGRDRISDQTGDAIARRRAELRRLQQQKQMSSFPMGGVGGKSGNGAGTPNVLEMSRMMFGGNNSGGSKSSTGVTKPSPPLSANGPPPTAAAPVAAAPPLAGSAAPPTKGIPPDMPPAQLIARARSSDIFKTAPKLVDSPNVPPPAPVARRLDDSFEHSMPDLTIAEGASSSKEQQKQHKEKENKSGESNKQTKKPEPPATKAAVPSPVVVVPPPPQVTPSSMASRSKSAPRPRPPPPPMMTVRAREAPATTTPAKTQTTKRVVLDKSAVHQRPTPMVPKKMPTQGTPHPGLLKKKMIDSVTTTPPVPMVNPMTTTTTMNKKDDNTEKKEIDIIPPIKQQQSPESQVEPKSEVGVESPQAVVEEKKVVPPPQVALMSKMDAEATGNAVPEMEKDLGKHTPFPKKKQPPAPLSIQDSTERLSIDMDEDDTPNSGVSSPPTTPRRDLLRNLREFADTPPPLAEEEKKEAPTPFQSQSQPPVIIAGAGGTPPVAATTTTTSSSSNGNKNKQTNELRLVQELRIAHDAKAEALRKVARLEGEMQRINSTKSMPSLETLVQVAEQKGAEQACEWARKQVTSTKGGPPPQRPVSQVGFLSPMAHGSGSPPNRLGAMSPLVSTPKVARKRVATPHPKRRTMTDEEKQKERKFLMNATQAVPYEYTSSLATYLVRQPYVDLPALGGEGGLWETTGIVSHKDYPDRTDVGNPQTIEILAQITADGSTLSLSGKSKVRHQKANDASGHWKVYENVDEMDQPMGCVMYIDGDANEKEYWLDAIYEEALATREAYCSSIISTASALQASEINNSKADATKNVAFGVNPPKAMNSPLMSSMQPPIAMMPEKPKPQMADACVGTEDMPFPPQQQQQAAPVQPAKGAPNGKPPKEGDADTKKAPSTKNGPPGVEKKAPPPTPEDDDASHDVLSIMLANVFQFFFWLAWSLFVRLPTKLMTFGLLMVINGFLLHLVWMFLADDHGAERMGAGIHASINPPGIL